MATTVGKKFLSTPSARRATRQSLFSKRQLKDFYPRPPRGGRLQTAQFCIEVKDISIHALREEGDYRVESVKKEAIIFLSTPSARRATSNIYRTIIIGFISIHALREEGDRFPAPQPDSLTRISIHALREEGDGQVGKLYRAAVISIHALREEGDSKNGEKHLRFCFIIKRSAQIWKSLSKNIRKNSCDLHRTA